MTLQEQERSLDRALLKDRVYMGVAKKIKELYTCPRPIADPGVGAVLLVDGRVVSTGYNGAPAGQPHCIDVGCTIIDGHCIRTVHAEKNVFDYYYKAKSSVIGDVVELYITIAPCLICTTRYLVHPYGDEGKLVKDVDRIILPNRMPTSYRGAESRGLWRLAGIEVCYVE